MSTEETTAAVVAVPTAELSPGQVLYDLRQRIAAERAKLTAASGSRTYEHALTIQTLEHELTQHLEAHRPRLV